MTYGENTLKGIVTIFICRYWARNVFKNVSWLRVVYDDVTIFRIFYRTKTTSTDQFIMTRAFA